MLHTCADLELFFDEVNRLTMQLLMHTPSKTIGLDSRYVFPFRSNPTFVKAIAALCERAGPNYQQIVTYLFKILPYADMELDYYTISHCIMDALAALTDMTYFQWLDNDSQLLIRDAIFRFLKPTNPYFTVKGMYDPSIELYAQRCEEELALQMGGILNQVLTSFNINEPVEFPLQYAKHVCDSLGSIKLNEKEGPRIQDSFPSKIIISSTKVLWNLIDTLDTAKVTKAFMHVTNECLRCPNLNTPWFSFFLLAAANFYGRCARPDAAADQEQNNLLSSLLGNLDKHSTSQSYWIFLACTICNLNPRLYSDHMDNFSTQVLKYALKSARGPISQQVTSLVALQNNTATAATTAPTKNPQPVVFTTIPRNEASTVEAGPRSGEDFRIDGANPSGQGSLFLYAPSLKGDRSNGGGFIRFEPDSEYTRGIENIYALDALTIALLGVPPFDPYPWVAVRAGTEGFTMPANFSLFNSQDSLSHRMFARKKDFVVNRKVLQKINDTLFLKKNTELPFYLLTVQPAARLVAAMSLHNLSYMDSTVFQPILATRTKFKRMQNIMLRVLRYMLLPSFGWFDSWAENMGHKVLLGEYESLNRKKQGTDTKTGFVAETAFWATGKETGDKLKLESAADSLSTISGANQVLIQAKNDTTITNRFADPIFTSTTNSHARAIFEGFLSTSILPLIQSLERKCESEVGSTKGGLASVEPSSSEIASVFTLLPKVRSSDDDSFDIDVHRVKMSDLPNTNAEVSSNFASSNPISLASPWDLSSSWYKASFLQRGAMSPSFVPDTIGLSQPLRFIQPTTDDPYMGDVPPFYASHLFTPSMSNSIFAVGEAQATRDELGAFPHTTLFDLPQLSKTRSRQIFHIGDQLESEWVKKKKTRLETDPPFQQELITNIQTGAGIIDLETSLTSTLASRVEREARVWASFKHYHLMVKREATRPKDTSIDGVKKRVIAHNNKFHVRPNPLHITNRTPLSATTDTSFSVQSEKRRLDGMKTSLEYEGGRLVRRSGLEVVNVLLDGSDLIIADEDERVGVSEVRGQIPKNAINLDDEDEADYDPSEALFGVDGLWSNAPDPLNGKPNTLDVVSGRTQFDVRIDGKKVKAGAEYRPAPSAMSHESMRVVLQSDVIVVEKEAVDVEPPDPNEQGITDEEKKKRKKDHREWVDRQEVLERRKKDPRHLKLYKDIRKLRDKEYDIDIATHRSRPAVTEMSPEEEIGYIRHRLSGNEDSPAADLLAILIYERARELEFPNLEKTMTPATAKALKPSFFTSDSKLYQSPLFTHSITTLWSVITKERGLPSVASVMMNSNAPQDNKDNPVILPNSTQSRSVFNSFRMDTLNAIACSSDLACTSTSNEEYAQVAMMGTSEAYAVLGQIAAQFRLNANRAHAPSLPGVKDIKDPRGKYSQYDPRLAFVMDLFEDKTLTFLRINPTNGTSRNEYDVLDDAFSSYLSTQVSSLPLILPDPPHLSPTPCITRPFTSLMAARTPYLYPLVVKQNKVLYYSLQQTIAEITPYFGLYAPESALKTFTSPGYLRLVLHRHAPIAVAASLALQRSMSLLPLHRASIVLSVVREIQDLPQTLSTFYSITFQDSRKADVQTLENDPFFTSRPQLSVGDAGLGLLPVTQGTTPLRFIHSNEHVVMTMANLLLLLVQQWDRSLVCELAALNARSAAVFSIPFGKPSSTRFVDLNAGQVKQHVPDLKKKDDKVKLPGAPAAPKSQEPESYNLFADFTGNETFTTSDLMTPLSGTSITTRQHMDTLLQVCQTLDGVSMFLLGHGSPSVRAIVLRLTSHLKRRITQIEADLDFLLSNKQKGQVGQGQKSNADELINQNSHVYRQMLRNLKRLLLEATTEQDPIVVRPTLYEIISGRRLSLEGQLYTGDNLWKRKQATEPQTSKFTPFAPSSVSIPHGISAQSMYELPKSSTLVATLESGRPRVGSSVSDKRSAILGTHVYNLKTDVGRDHPSFLQEMLQIGGRDATVAEQMALYPDGYAPVLLYTPLSAKWISDFVARRASVKAITPSAGSTWVNLLPCLRAPLAPSEMIPDEPNLSSSGGYVYDNDYNIFSLLQSRAETRLASITSFSLLGALRSAQQLPLRALGRPLVAKAFKSLIQTVASAPDTSTLNTGNPDGAKKPSELIQLLISNGTGRPESKLPNAPFDPVQTTPSMLWVLSVLGGLDHQYARWSAELLASDTDVTHPKAFQREIEKEQERLKDLAVDCTSASISEAMNKDDQAVADRMRNALRQTNLGNRVARLADRVVNQVRDAAQNIAGDEANERDKQRNSLEQYVSLHLTSLQDLFANRHSLETLWTSLLGQITHQYGASGSTVGIRAFHHTAAWFYKSVHRIPENYPSAIKMDTAFECGFREMVGNTLVGTLALGPVSSADMSTEQFLKERKENVKLKMKTDTEAQPSRTETTDQDPEQANSSFEETKSTLYSPAENPVFLDGFNLILKQVLPQVFSTLGSTFMSLQYAGMIALSNLHPHLILDTLNAFETWTKTAFPSMEVLKKEFSNIKGDDEGQRLANKKEQQKFIRAKFSPVQYINLSNLIPRFLRIIAENDSFSLALSLNPAPIMRYYMSLCAAVIEFPLLRNGKPRIPAFGDYLLPLTQRSKGQRNMAGRSVKTIPGDMDINDLIIRNSTEQNIDEYDELMRKLDAGEEEDDTLGDVPNFTTGLQSADFDVPEANLPFIGPYYQTMFMGKGMLSHVFPQYGKSLMSKPNPKLEEQVNRSMNVVVTHFTKGQANEIDLKIVDGNRHKVTLLLTTQLGRPSNPLDYVMRAVDSMGALSALARALSVGFLPPEELRINPPLPIIATAETVNEFSVSCGLVPSIFLTTASLEQLMSNHLKDIHLYSSTKPDTVPEDQFSKNIHNLYSLHASLMSRWMWRTNLASTGDLYGHPFQYLSLSAPQQSLIGADAQLADALLTSAPSIIRGSLRSAVSDGVSHVISQFVETHECAEENNTAARFIPYNPAPVSIHPASADLSGLSYVSTGSGAAATLPQRSLDNPSQIDITSVDRINQTPANALADSLLFMSGKSKDDVPPATLPSVMSVIVQSHLDSVPMASLSKGLLRALLLFPVAYRIELLRLAMNHAAYGEFSVPMNIVTSVGANRLELYLNEKYENEKAQYVPYFNTEEGVNQAKRAAPALFNYGMNPYTASPGKNFVYRQGGAYGRPWMKSGYKTLLQLRTVFSPLSIVDNFWHYTLALSGHGHAAVSYLIRLLDPRLQDIMKNNRLVPRIEYLSMQKAPEAPASIHGESGGSHLKFSNEDEDEMEDMAPEKLRTDRGYENEWKIDAAALGKENRKESKKLKQLKAAEEDQTKQTLVPQSGSPLAKMARSPKRQNQNQSSGAINITTVPTNDLVIGMEPLFPSIVNQIEQQFYGVQTAGKKPQVKTTSSIKESLPPYAPLLISEKSITFYALAEAHQNRLVEIRSKAGTVLPKAPQLSFLLGNSYPDRAQPPAILTDPDTEIVMPNQLTWEDVKKPKVSADELIQVTDPSLFSHSFGAASSVRSLPFILQVLLFYPQHVSIHILSRCFSDESSIASLFKIAIMKFFTSARFDPVSLRNLDLTPGLILPSINELSKRNKQLYSSVLSFALSNLISSIPSIRLASVQLIRAIVRFQLSEYEQEELLLVYQRMKAKEMNDVSSRRPGAAKPGNPLSGSGDPSMQKLSDSDYYTQKCASLLMVLSLLNHHTPSLANAYSVESLYQSGQAISDSVFRAFPDLLLPVVQASFTNLTQISSNLPLHTSGTLSITDRAPASLFYAENNSEVWNMHPLFISQPSPLEFTSDLARLIVTYDTTFSQSHSLLRLIAPWAEHTDLLATSPDERVQFLQVMFGLVQIWIQKRERQSTGPAALPGIVAPFSSRSIRKFPALPTLSRATIAENDPLLKEAISIWERMAASTSTIENANQRVSRQSLGQGNLMSNLAALEGGDSTLNPIAVPQTNAPIASLTTSQPMSISNNLPVPPNVQLVVRAVLSQIFKTIGTGSTLPAFHILHALFSSYPKVVMNDISLLLTPALWKSLVGVQHAFLIATKRAHATEIDPKTSDKPQGPRHRRLQSSLSKSQRGTDVPSISGVPEGDLERKQRSQIRHVLSQSSIQLKQAGFGRIVVAHILGSIASKNPSIIEEYIPILLAFAVVHSASTQSVIVKKAYGRNYQEQKTKGSKLPLIDARKTHNGLNKHFAEDPSEATTLTSPSAVIKVFLVRLIEVILLLRDSQPQSYFIPVPEGKGDEPADVASDPPSKKEKPRFSDNYPSSFRYGEWQARQNFKEMLPLFSQSATPSQADVPASESWPINWDWVDEPLHPDLLTENPPERDAKRYAELNVADEGHEVHETTMTHNRTEGMPLHVFIHHIVHILLILSPLALPTFTHTIAEWATVGGSQSTCIAAIECYRALIVSITRLSTLYPTMLCLPSSHLASVLGTSLTVKEKPMPPVLSKQAMEGPYAKFVSPNNPNGAVPTSLSSPLSAIRLVDLSSIFSLLSSSLCVPGGSQYPQTPLVRTATHGNILEMSVEQSRLSPAAATNSEQNLIETALSVQRFSTSLSDLGVAEAEISLPTYSAPLPIWNSQHVSAAIISLLDTTLRTGILHHEAHGVTKTDLKTAGVGTVSATQKQLALSSSLPSMIVEEIAQTHANYRRFNPKKASPTPFGATVFDGVTKISKIPPGWTDIETDSSWAKDTNNLSTFLDTHKVVPPREYLLKQVSLPALTNTLEIGIIRAPFLMLPFSAVTPVPTAKIRNRSTVPVYTQAINSISNILMMFQLSSARLDALVQNSNADYTAPKGQKTAVPSLIPNKANFLTWMGDVDRNTYLDQLTADSGFLPLFAMDRTLNNRIKTVMKSPYSVTDEVIEQYMLTFSPSTGSKQQETHQFHQLLAPSPRGHSEGSVNFLQDRAAASFLSSAGSSQILLALQTAGIDPHRVRKFCFKRNSGNFCCCSIGCLVNVSN
ncbi:hypothetical protein BLNAU_87 [Blattamonas nauphoetae]|uniref:Uncharacterized protein n=1 Tax=Blattamonas nauphoetae TaxID=2049346 RepID=A0ABQ9YM17_9EUKA|nr:hypothetical protein BLNAU_87 [Blattamonas nauphoetae]